MRDPNRKVIYMLWTVIIVLVIGCGVGGYMLTRKADDLTTSNSELTGSNLSLREQLRQAKATPSVTPSPSAAPSPSITPSPSSSPSPTASAKPQL